MKRIPDLVPVILTMNDEFWLPYVLASVQGRFDRYVIYDVGSEDMTWEVIQSFVEAEKAAAEIFYRKLPYCAPEIQGIFRNSMIAEARSDWYFILDGDEIYNPEALDALADEMENMKHQYEENGKTYGIVRRVEVMTDMKSAYGQNLDLKHHRVYHKDMIFVGPHPGEAPLVEQKKKNEHWFSKDVICYHFHNCNRSRLDEMVPKRIARRKKATYHRGEATPIDILQKVPLLRGKFNEFLTCPELEVLWSDVGVADGPTSASPVPDAE